MPTLQIRLTDELHAFVKEHGGSPYVRALLEREQSALSVPSASAQNGTGEDADRVGTTPPHSPVPDLDNVEELVAVLEETWPGGEMIERPAQVIELPQARQTSIEAEPENADTLFPLHLCSRWMHHRKGVRCTACNETP
jgi:hypothetical protein